MSLFDRLTHWFAPAAEPHPGPPLPRPEPGPILDAIATVIDPEVGIDIVAMGLIRGIAVDGQEVRVRMTLSTRGCPVGPAMVDEVVQALAAVGYAAEVEMEFEPPWTVEDITDEGRARLGR